MIEALLNLIKSEEDPEAYKKLSESGVMLAHPVKINGKDVRDDNGVGFHATVKNFDPKTDCPGKAHDLASTLKLPAPDPKTTQIEPDEFLDRNGATVYVLKLKGNSAEKLKENNAKFAHMGYQNQNFVWTPHISIPKALHEQIKAAGHKTAEEAGITFGPAELKRGNQTLKTYHHQPDSSEPVIPEPGDPIAKSEPNLESADEDAHALLNRKEDKYFLPRQHLDRVISELSDRFALGDIDTDTRHTTNRTIYLDDKDLSAFKDCIIKNTPRTKVRIRQYSPNSKGWEKVAYAEFKIKEEDGQTKKIRVRIPSTDVEGLANGGRIKFDEELININKDIERRILESRVQAINNAISRKGLRKQIELRYDRRAYTGKNLRITIDDNLTFLNAVTVDPTVKDGLDKEENWSKFIKPYLAAAWEQPLILEVKSGAEVPNWLVNLLDECNAKESSFSKYSAGMLTHLKTGLSSGKVLGVFKEPGLEKSESLEGLFELLKNTATYIAPNLKTNKRNIKNNPKLSPENQGRSGSQSPGNTRPDTAIQTIGSGRQRDIFSKKLLNNAGVRNPKRNEDRRQEWSESAADQLIPSGIGGISNPAWGKNKSGDPAIGAVYSGKDFGVDQSNPDSARHVETTKNHEGFHGTMAAIRHNYGNAAAEKLLSGMHSMFDKPAMEALSTYVQSIKGGDSKPLYDKNSPDYKEELLNYARDMSNVGATRDEFAKVIGRGAAKHVDNIRRGSQKAAQHIRHIEEDHLKTGGITRPENKPKPIPVSLSHFTATAPDMGVPMERSEKLEKGFVRNAGMALGMAGALAGASHLAHADHNHVDAYVNSMKDIPGIKVKTQNNAGKHNGIVSVGRFNIHTKALLGGGSPMSSHSVNLTGPDRSTWTPQDSQDYDNAKAVHQHLTEKMPELMGMSGPVKKAENVLGSKPLLKPFLSEQQRKWAHTPTGKKALGGEAAVHEWDEATKGKKLPKRVAKSDYRDSHRSPNKESGAPLHEMTSNGTFPADIYSHKAAHYYGHGSDKNQDHTSVRTIHSVKGKPEALVEVHRAVPHHVNAINPGDWVSINKDYAKEHGENRFDGKYKMLSRMVPAKEVYAKDSIHEQGWHPETKIEKSQQSLAKA